MSLVLRIDEYRFVIPKTDFGHQVSCLEVDI